MRIAVGVISIFIIFLGGLLSYRISTDYFMTKEISNLDLFIIMIVAIFAGALLNHGKDSQE